MTPRIRKAEPRPLGSPMDYQGVSHSVWSMELGPPIALDTASTGIWPPGMAVLVPVYNHAATVGQVVREAMALGAPVLVVDDGSTDGSGQAAAEAGGEVITLPVNQGKAAALRSGMAEAQRRGFRQILTADADGQHPTVEIRNLAQRAKDEPAAIHIGARDMRSAPFISRLGRFLSNSWSLLACGAWLGDSQSGLRVYPLPATTALDAPADRYAYEIEVLVRAAWARIPVRTLRVAVIYPEDRVSHFGKFRDNIRGGLVLCRLCWYRLCPWKGTRPAAVAAASESMAVAKADA
jgi:glycosyltransferase involved in cell wall biosynthesis